jgi:hypothetical protein
MSNHSSCGAAKSRHLESLKCLYRLNKEAFEEQCLQYQKMKKQMRVMKEKLKAKKRIMVDALADVAKTEKEYGLIELLSDDSDEEDDSSEEEKIAIIDLLEEDDEAEPEASPRKSKKRKLSSSAIPTSDRKACELARSSSREYDADEDQDWQSEEEVQRKPAAHETTSSIQKKKEQQSEDEEAVERSRHPAAVTPSPTRMFARRTGERQHEEEAEIGRQQGSRNESTAPCSSKKSTRYARDWRNLEEEETEGKRPIREATSSSVSRKKLPSCARRRNPTRCSRGQEEDGGVARARSILEATAAPSAVQSMVVTRDCREDETEEISFKISRRQKSISILASAIPIRRSVGRSRDWLNNNLEFGACGFTAKFSQGAFGTKTTNSVTKVEFLAVNDVYNELVTRQGEEQILHVGVGTNRRKFGHALARQGSAVAVFHAPKVAENTKSLYYVGHWVANRQLEVYPESNPFVFKDIPRQMRIQLQFVRYDESLAKMMEG